VLGAVEKQGTSDKWNTRGSTETKYLNLHDDAVLVPAAAFDIGGPV
jgi:hypothetical protein